MINLNILQLQAVSGGIQYVNVNVSSDEDDEAFLPSGAENCSPPPYVNVSRERPVSNGGSQSLSAAGGGGFGGMQGNGEYERP